MPSVGVMTEKFVSAADLMTRVLGADGHEYVTIPHPISSATPDQLAEVASIAADECAALLTSSEGNATHLVAERAGEVAPDS